LLTIPGIQFLTAAGLKTEAAFSLNMVLNCKHFTASWLLTPAMFIIGTMASWVIMTFFGRRTVYTAGMALMSAVLLVIGGLGFFSKDKVSEDPVVYSHKYQQVSSAIGGLLIMLNFVYNA
jgi:SP family general alpha glucoside:H+ symporter-like MFS transporter